MDKDEVLEILQKAIEKCNTDNSTEKRLHFQSESPYNLRYTKRYSEYDFAKCQRSEQKETVELFPNTVFEIKKNDINNCTNKGLFDFQKQLFCILKHAKRRKIHKLAKCRRNKARENVDHHQNTVIRREITSAESAISRKRRKLYSEPNFHEVCFD
ncbi:hypothetical protein J6590_058362 [Homalodisca vitripennis]|nr:hypothetical protein J6590_058362 [Homalodisca vitripennis]